MKAKFTAAITFALCTLPLHGQLRPVQHYALSAAQVARILTKAFAERGVLIGDSQVVLPADVLASDPDPVLEVRGIETLGHLPANQSGEVSSAVKLACAKPGTCVPFYAIVRLPQELALKPTTTPANHAALLPVRRATADYALKAGARATLMMEDGRSHIQLAVVAMQNGAVGDIIRASSPDHKQTYKAEVVSGTLLKGSF